MSDKPENPPAFPVPEHKNAHGIVGATTGMDLRDYFAAAALQGILAANSGREDAWPSTDVCAKRSYQYADAMLTARSES